MSKPVSGKLDLVEVIVRPGRTPKGPKLRQLRERHRAELSFSVVAGEECLGSEAAAALELVRQAVEALSARFVVVRAPSSLRPGHASERCIERALSALAGAPDARLLFEPSGLWQPLSTRALCRSWGVGQVERLEELTGSVACPERPYLRVVQMGTGRTRVAKQLDTAALVLAACEEGVVVVEGGGAAKVRAALEMAMGDFEQDPVE